MVIGVAMVIVTVMVCRLARDNELWSHFAMRDFGVERNLAEDIPPYEAYRKAMNGEQSTL